MDAVQRILVVEDDAPLAELVARALERENYQVTVCGRGDDAVPLIIDDQPDLVLLDLMLPGIDGFEVCKRVRAQMYRGCIIMVTAREQDVDQVLGLELGADDYLVKPVTPRVLLARVRAHLRRAGSTTAEELRVGPLTIVVDSRRVLLRDQAIDLTTSEYDLLLHLAERAGEVVGRDELYRELRGVDYDGLDRAMDLRVSKVRSRLRAVAPDLELIKTVHGRGYLLVRETL